MVPISISETLATVSTVSASEKNLRWHVCRANFVRRMFFLSYKLPYEKCSDIFPDIFEPLFCGSEKSPKIPAKFPTKFPCQESKRIHRRASAGAQGQTTVSTVSVSGSCAILKHVFPNVVFKPLSLWCNANPA